MNPVIQEIKNSYKFPVFIFIFAIIITVGLKSRIGIFESSIIFDVLIVFLPLAASVASFVVSYRYGKSKIFGRSYFLLSCGFFSTFFGELLYFLYGNILDESIAEFFDYFFFTSYLFTIAHIVINVRYFTEKIEPFQKTLIILVPVVVVGVYSYLVYQNSYDLDYFFYFNLIFVSVSAVNLGLVLVGFTLFRHTVLISAWFLLLVGFFIGTLGDLEFRYYHTFGANFLGNNSTVLWLTSFMILVYALYRHTKSM